MQENICIHNTEVCDNITHCNLSFEDEAICNFTKSCPENCKCANIIVICTMNTFEIGSFLDTQVEVLKFQVIISEVSNYLYPKLLERYSNLLYFSASNCQIMGLSGNSFSFQHLIQTLDISSNNLMELHPNMFKNNEHLKFLFMQNNHIENLVFHLFLWE